MTSVLEVQGAAITGRLARTDLFVGAGEFVALIGPNGGGKTSLLRACAGLEGTGGNVRVAGEDLRTVSPARRAALLGYLPASRDVVWPIPVRDVIALGLASADPERVDELIHLLELVPFAAKTVNRLSTGERARVLLARVLASRPRVLLLDEPLSNLEPYWVLRLLEVLRLIADSGTAVIVVLHDIERMAAFDRVLLVDRGEIHADLPPGGMIASPVLSESLRIDRSSSDWQLRPRADPQSLR
ncbi:iron complex transport system ATP-binding protein [Sphingomonas sp. F9_3S_D5_B_2]